jgi:hypothetical protein
MKANKGANQNAITAAMKACATCGQELTAGIVSGNVGRAGKIIPAGVERSRSAGVANGVSTSPLPHSGHGEGAGHRRMECAATVYPAKKF